MAAILRYLVCTRQVCVPLIQIKKKKTKYKKIQYWIKNSQFHIATIHREWVLLFGCFVSVVFFHSRFKVVKYRKQPIQIKKVPYITWAACLLGGVVIKYMQVRISELWNTPCQCKNCNKTPPHDLFGLWNGMH